MDKNKKCPNCGKDLPENAKFCAECGNSVEHSEKDSHSESKKEPLNKKAVQVDTELIKQQIRELQYTEENQNRLKHYLANNLILIHSIYLIIFVLALVEPLLGIIGLIIGGGYIYYQAIRTEGHKSELNDKVLQMIKTTSDQTKSGIEKAIHQADEGIDKVKNKADRQIQNIKSDDSEEDSKKSSKDSENTPVNTQKNELTVQNKMGMATIASIISAIMSLYGVFGGRFFDSYGYSTSLNNYFNMLTNGLNTLSSFSSGFGELIPNEQTDQFTSYATIASWVLSGLKILIIVAPVLYILFVLLRKYNTARIIAIVEVVSLVLVTFIVMSAIGDSFGEYANDFYSFSFSSLGGTAYVFFIGLIGMVVSSFFLKNRKNK